MNPELRELYQSVILDHNKQPRNFGELPEANGRAEGHNPLCGDHLSVAVRIEEDRLLAIAFEGQGCAISTASASLMSEAVKGLPVSEVRGLFERFHKLVTSDPMQESASQGLGKLEVFSGVREFPIRVKCATLGWHTLQSALSDGDSVSTE
ncbi:MAG: SUF system NifU family Fe-S cluster assembly protein [Myxococcales bacterium]|nr:SUF system NifU family Fe-S cluster assembly protein [Myxococcales bacterium]